MPKWPPEDSGVLLDRWREMGSPEIGLVPGVSIVDLQKWFDPMVFPTPSAKELARVRVELELEAQPEEQRKLF